MSKSVAAKNGDPDRVPGDDGVWGRQKEKLKLSPPLDPFLVAVVGGGSGGGRGTP